MIVNELVALIQSYCYSSIHENYHFTHIHTENSVTPNHQTYTPTNNNCKTHKLINMKIIQKFESYCGKVFNTSEECLKYEEISKQVDVILSTLIDSRQYDEDCSFSNGKGFVQHPQNTYKILEKELLKLSNEWFKPKKFESVNFRLERYIEDSGITCLNKLSYKLMCIDELGREFGQVYYRNNPQDSELFALNYLP